MPPSLPAERAVQVRGLRWGVIDTPGRTGDGSGPALLMLPGTLGTAAIFGPTLQALGQRIRIVSVTYPLIDDIGRLADGLDGLMRRLSLTRASVAGSSLGGFLAQHFAARHPARVQGLLLGNTLWDPGQMRGLVGSLSLDALRALPAAAHRDIVLRSVRSWPVDTPARRALQTVLLHSGEVLLGARALKARVLALQLAPAVPPLALAPERITVLDCADDPLIPRPMQDSMLQRYPGAQHVRLDGGGHYPNILRTADYNAVVQRVVAGGAG